MSTSFDEQPYIAIISGGVGTRLWPRSRRQSPKQLIQLAAGRSLIQQTFARIAPLTSPQRIFVVTVAAQEDAVRVQLPVLPPENIIAEPEGRNTAMAIGLAITHIAAVDPDAMMISVGSDHFIGDDEAYRRTLQAAMGGASGGKHLVTVGISPTSPDTGYGYIQRGEVVGTHAGTEIFQVLDFKEKPSVEVARKYIRSQEYLWNGNYFIWRIPAALAAYSEFAPDILERMNVLLGAVGRDSYSAVLADTYKHVRAVPIDTAIIEKATNVLTVPGQFPWIDVGTWSGAYKIADAHGGNYRTGSRQNKVLFLDSMGCLVDASDRAIVLIGLEDVIVIDTDDALLVCARDEAQRVGDVVSRLGEEGLEQLL